MKNGVLRVVAIRSCLIETLIGMNRSLPRRNPKIGPILSLNSTCRIRVICYKTGLLEGRVSLEPSIFIPNFS